MRHSRRQRRYDPLASASAVRGVLDAFAREIGTRIHVPSGKLASLVRAVCHARRHPERSSRPGRPPLFRDGDLLIAGQALEAVLLRETSGRVSLRCFSNHYLLIPEFPHEVEAALREGEINLAEAHQLARLTARNLGLDDDEKGRNQARRLRMRVLHSHTSAQSHELSLRQRVSRALEEARGTSTPAVGDPSFDEQLEADSESGSSEELSAAPADHFFLDVLTTIERTIRVLGEGEISPGAQERIYEHGDQILLILRREEAARARRASKPTRVLI